MENYIEHFIIDYYQNELSNEVKKALPKLQQMGITTPQAFRDKFNNGSMNYPSFMEFVNKLDELNGNQRPIKVSLEITDNKLVKQLVKAIQKKG